MKCINKKIFIITKSFKFSKKFLFNGFKNIYIGKILICVFYRLRKMILPLLRSYGVNSTVTLSPVRILM